jgi:hypothetical protein
MAAAIAIFTIAGFAVLFGILISDCIAGRRHQAWMESRNTKAEG